MSWNYRIIRHPGDEPHGYYGLHEVYYNKDGSIKGWIEALAGFLANISEGPEGIAGALQLALNDARRRPVLEWHELPMTDDEGEVRELVAEDFAKARPFGKKDGG